MEDRVLIRLANRAEDIAYGLHTFRDNLRSDRSEITAIIGGLFLNSSHLRGLDRAENDRDNWPSFYRIEEDLRVLIRSLHWTFDDVFEMFALSRERPYEVVWDDLNHYMNEEERFGFLQRLEMYSGFLKAQSDILYGIRSGDLDYRRQQILDLWRNQQNASRQRVTRGISDSSMWTINAVRSCVSAETNTYSASSTPRPLPTRHLVYRVQTPSSPTIFPNEWDFLRPPPIAPEVPIFPEPISSSSLTLSASQTNYAPNFHALRPRRFVHWAEQIFDGEYPCSPFHPDYQL